VEVFVVFLEWHFCSSQLFHFGKYVVPITSKSMDAFVSVRS